LNHLLERVVVVVVALWLFGRMAIAVGVGAFCGQVRTIVARACQSFMG